MSTPNSLPGDSVIQDIHIIIKETDGENMMAVEYKVDLSKWVATEHSDPRNKGKVVVLDKGFDILVAILCKNKDKPNYYFANRINAETIITNMDMDPYMDFQSKYEVGPYGLTLFLYEESDEKSPQYMKQVLVGATIRPSSHGEKKTEIATPNEQTIIWSAVHLWSSRQTYLRDSKKASDLVKFLESQLLVAKQNQEKTEESKSSYMHSIDEGICKCLAFSKPTLV